MTTAVLLLLLSSFNVFNALRHERNVRRGTQPRRRSVRWMRTYIALTVLLLVAALINVVVTFR